MKNWIEKICRQNGFTLIEVLVSLTIMSFVLPPIFILASNSVSSAETIRNNVIASNLAQEGIEVVRAVRDSNWTAIPSRSFDDNLAPGDYIVDWDSAPGAAPASLPVWADVPLKYSDRGVYNYASGTSTIFKRKITVTKPSASELKIISDVTWKDRTGDKSLQVEDHLFSWRY